MYFEFFCIALDNKTIIARKTAYTLNLRTQFSKKIKILRIFEKTEKHCNPIYNDRGCHLSLGL